MDILAALVALWLVAPAQNAAPTPPRTAPRPTVTAPATGGSAVPGAPPLGPMGLALVRADGMLQPLATFDADRWSPLRPADAAGAWTVWLFDDPALKASPFAERTARTITAAAATGTPCASTTGLGPDVLGAGAAAAAPGLPASPKPVGLAVRGSEIRPDLPAAVGLDTELGRQLAARAAASFHRAEDETLTLESEELPPGFPRFAARRERPLTWAVMARQGLALGAARSYYLEGHKDYAEFRGRTDIGRIRTTGHVFVQMVGDRETMDAEVDLSDLDGHQSVFRTPLAIVGSAPRTAWLFTTRGPDGGHVEIVELSPGISRPHAVWQGPDGCQQGTP